MPSPQPILAETIRPSGSVDADASATTRPEASTFRSSDAVGASALARSRTNTSLAALASPGTRFVDVESNATNRPVPALSRGQLRIAPLPSSPAVEMSARSVAPWQRSRRTTPGVAVSVEDSIATVQPSSEICGGSVDDRALRAVVAQAGELGRALAAVADERLDGGGLVVAGDEVRRVRVEDDKAAVGRDLREDASPLASPPADVTSARVRWLVSRSMTTMSRLAFVSPGAMSLASVANTTKRPLSLASPFSDPPLACEPSGLALMRVTGPPAVGTRRTRRVGVRVAGRRGCWPGWRRRRSSRRR